jgi:hypothetical protein
MSTPGANQGEGCLQRTTHDGRARCMQFLLCYPRISPTVNTVGDKKSVPVTDSPAHQIEACLGPQSGLFAQIDPCPSSGVALLPPKKVMAPSSSIFPPSPHAHAAAHPARAIVPKRVVRQHGVGAPGEKPLEPVGMPFAQNLSCMHE